ncbi:MAG: amidohydrolase family protein, partial [Thermaerobacter sp.]|nr:amidohydrolase family protein [Thermaerobacter sp.]
DYGLLKRTNVGVAHNPVSNLKLGSGVAPLETLLKQGVRVGLGTDGAASTNSLDLFQELRLAALLAKGMTGEPTAVTALQALELATTGGARALGLEGVIGRISPGYAADLITVDLTAPHLVPVHDPASALAYAATGRDVRTVLVDGRVVVERGVVRTVDVQRVCREVKQRAARLVAP